MHDLTGFQRDDHVAIAGLDGPGGLEVTGGLGCHEGARQTRDERERIGSN